MLNNRDVEFWRRNHGRFLEGLQPFLSILCLEGKVFEVNVDGRSRRVRLNTVSSPSHVVIVYMWYGRIRWIWYHRYRLCATLFACVRQSCFHTRFWQTNCHSFLHHRGIIFGFHLLRILTWNICLIESHLSLDLLHFDLQVLDILLQLINDFPGLFQLFII